MTRKSWEDIGVKDLRERLCEVVGTTVTDITVAAGSLIISFSNGKELVLFHADYENMIASYDGLEVDLNAPRR
ncbi:hypothetical protein EDM68_01515 [Candidatus Uhrbacteria bacterium]|nr:MAG: hypothetical protein EDM68_01515 [Candidatus Uhrbacteria bacterium]